jgi:predicted transcriptional regulator
MARTSSKITPTRPIRVDLDLWAKFGKIADQLDTDRSALIRDFIRWMVREPGAKLPKRPAAPPT